MTKFVMNIFVMKNLIKNARLSKGLKVKELASLLKIDQALVSKFESGIRNPTIAQIKAISFHLNIPFDELQKLWLKEKILSEIKYYSVASDVLLMVQEELQKYNVSFQRKISQKLQGILDEIDTYKAILDEKRKVNNTRIREALEIEYTFESNKIEGNTLTLMETDLVINQGLTISGKSMREHLEAINHKEAIDYINYLVEKNSEFNERELLSIHNLILRGIHSEEAGKYRTVQVMIQGSKHLPPAALIIQDEMQDLFNWYNMNQQLHPVVLAAELHERIVTVHPFIDGNGRTSRLIMNLFLLKNGYVLANIKGDYETRMKYYQCLEEAQISHSKDTFIEFIAQTELESIKRYVTILG